MYYILTTYTSVGYGDIHSTNNTERLFSIVFMIFGVAFYSYLIGKITNIY